jgi:uncharacterized protein YecT (DUF1311 family)
MRKVIIIFIIMIVSCTNTTEVQSEFDSNENTQTQLNRTDIELNKVYQEIFHLYEDDKQFIEHLNLSQKAWLQYRNAQLQALYPARDKREYGSVYSTCYDSAKARLASARIEELRVWLKGIEEGEVCAGSIKYASELDQLKKKKY